MENPTLKKTVVIGASTNPGRRQNIAGRTRIVARSDRSLPACCPRATLRHDGGPGGESTAARRRAASGVELAGYRVL